MLNYPKHPVKRRRSYQWHLIIPSVISIIGICFAGYGMSQTHTEVVQTGKPLEIARGHLETIETHSMGKTRVYEQMENDRHLSVVVDGIPLMKISRYVDGTSLDHFIKEEGSCIYLQDHLTKTTYFEKYASYHGYKTFEGIRSPSADDQCPAFPVD